MEKMNIQFFASDDTGIEKRHMKAEYLDVRTKEDSPTYELMGTGFTEANEEVGAQTASRSSPSLIWKWHLWIRKM